MSEPANANDVAAAASSSSVAASSSSVSHADGTQHPATSRSEMAAAIAELPRTVKPGTTQAEAIAQARALNAAWAAALPALLKPEPDCKRPALLYTDVAGVWDTFTANLPPELRSLWLPCRRCGRWLSSFGHIVVLRGEASAAEQQQETSESAAEGAIMRAPRVIPLFWDESVEALAPPVFSPAIRAVRALFAGGADKPLALAGPFIPVLEVQPGSSSKSGRTLGVEKNSVEPPGACKEGEAAAAALAALALDKEGGDAVTSSAPADSSSTRTYWHACFTFPASACQDVDDAHAYSTYAEMLTRALMAHPLSTVRLVHQWLMQGQIDYADQHKPAIDMLFKLKQRWDLLAPPQRELVLWQTLCGRTSGVAGMISSVRTGMVSTLLADAYAETNFEDVKRKWNALANPTTYMRATEAPSAGNVAAAERLFAELGITHRDLDRRFLRRTEVPQRALAWQRQPLVKEQAPAQLAVAPPEAAAASSAASSSSSSKSGGLFSKVKTMIGLATAADAVVRCNFLSFLSRPELAAAAKVELDLPATINAVMFVTGLPGSVPLMQWHTESNLASSYSYSQLRDVALFGLRAGWTEVHSILSFPHQWDEPESFAQHGRRWLLALEGLAERVAPTGTLFAANMQSKFHGVRATIEAHNQTATVSGKETMGQDGVAGWMIDVNPKPQPAAVVRVRVTGLQGQQTTFELSSEGESDAPPKQAEGQAAAAAAAAPGGVAVADGK